MKPRMFIALLMAALLVVPAAAAAQDSYPSQPVRLIVPLAAGSSTDVAARVVGRKIGELIDQTVIVDNRPGAGGNIAGMAVARSSADGHTLLFGSTSLTVNATLTPTPDFDLAKDLTPIALIGTVPNILLVHSSLGVKSVPELITKLRSEPGRVVFASSGVGTSPHLSAELFSMMEDVKMVHVPYKGSSLAMADLVAGRTSLMFTPAPTAIPHMKSSNLIALASTQFKRASVAPDLPTMDELGFKGFDTGVWFGLFAPAGTPQTVLDKLAKAANEAVKTPEVLEALATQGIDPLGGSTPEEFGAYVRSEIEKWAKVIKTAGVTR